MAQKELTIVFDLDRDACHAAIMRLVALKGVQVLDDEQALFSIIREHIKFHDGSDLLEAETIE